MMTCFLISVINQLDAQHFCFTISLFHASTCFEHMCLSSGGRLVRETAMYKCDDTRDCVMQFWPPDDEHTCSKHVEAWNKTYCKTKSLCIKLVNYWYKYTEVHGQQNVKIYDDVCCNISKNFRIFCQGTLFHLL